MFEMMVGVGGFAALILLILLRMPIGIASLIVGFGGYAFLTDFEIALSQLGMNAFGSAANYSFSVIPMFILMGMFLSYSGLARDLFGTVGTWMGHLRGGMALVTIGVSAIFASVAGSINATTATIAKVAIPEMDKYKYKPSLSTACVAAGGTLGILIPPSIILVIYGIQTMEPIGQLLIAGIVPGILMTLIFMATVFIVIRRDPEAAPAGQKRAEFSEMLISLKNIGPFAVIFIISIGGLYFGFFTPTEGGAVGAVGAFLVALSMRRMNLKLLLSSLYETVRIVCMMFMILVGAALFGKFLAITNLPMTLTAFVAELDVSRYVVLAMILIVFIVLAGFMDEMAILVLTLPIVHPLIIDLGFDGVWFGVIMVLMTSIGMLTPPIGNSVFVINGVVKHIPVPVIFKGVIPMVIAMVIFVVILIIFPDIVTFLPSRM